MIIRHLLAISLFTICPVWAQTPVSDSTLVVPQTLEEAATHRERAKTIRDSAEKRHVADQAACYKKFLVNGCLEDVKKSYTQAMIEARKLDNPARDFQREAKRSEQAAKEEKRRADLSLRTIDQKEQAEKFRSAEAAKTVERTKKEAARAQKAQAGRKKTAEEQVKRQARQEKNAKKDAERAAKKTREDEKRGIEAAAKAAATPE